MALYIDSDMVKIPDCCGACSFQFGGHCTVQPSEIDDAWVPNEGKPEWCPLKEHEDAVDELYTILDEVCQDFREKTEEDYVCGLCQYDGAYKGDSGDWCNECPGFETADCFTMNNKIRKMCGKDLLPEP